MVASGVLAVDLTTQRQACQVTTGVDSAFLAGEMARRGANLGSSLHLNDGVCIEDKFSACVSLSRCCVGALKPDLSVSCIDSTAAGTIELQTLQANSQALSLKTTHSSTTAVVEVSLFVSSLTQSQSHSLQTVSSILLISTAIQMNDKFFPNKMHFSANNSSTFTD